MSDLNIREAEALRLTLDCPVTQERMKEACAVTIVEMEERARKVSAESLSAAAVAASLDVLEIAALCREAQRQITLFNTSDQGKALIEAHNEVARAVVARDNALDLYREAVEALGDCRHCDCKQIGVKVLRDAVLAKARTALGETK